MRERKKINYATFGEGDELDDDFADPTPPSKKLTSNKENKLKSKKKEKVVKYESKKTDRPSLEDRLYERNLQSAVDLSLGDSADFPTEEEDDVILVDSPNTEQALVTVEIVPNPTGDSPSVDQDVDKFIPDEPPKAKAVTSVVTKRPADRDDDLEILEVNVAIEQAAKRQCISSKNKSKYVDSDSEASNFSSASESDNDFSGEEEGSDFEAEMEVKAKAKPTAKSAEKKEKPVSKPEHKKSKPVPKAKISAPKTHVANTKCITSPSVSCETQGSSGNGLARRVAWTPPASSSSCKSSLGGGTMTSPTSGIRLGLSRNQRVKSLHPSLNIQQ